LVRPDHKDKLEQLVQRVLMEMLGQQASMVRKVTLVLPEIMEDLERQDQMAHQEQREHQGRREVKETPVHWELRVNRECKVSLE